LFSHDTCVKMNWKMAEQKCWCGMDICFWKRQQTMTQAFSQNKHSCMNRWKTRLMSFSYTILSLTQTHENVNTTKLCLFQNKKSNYSLVSQDVIKFCVKHRLPWQSVQLYKEKTLHSSVWSWITLLSWCNKQHKDSITYTLCLWLTLLWVQRWWWWWYDNDNDNIE
jgi:hypothetical protein